MEIWKQTKPYPGAHIRVKTKDIYHHGIYIGDDKVVQFGHPFSLYTADSDIRVTISSATEFTDIGPLEVRFYNDKEAKLKKSDQEIIKTALDKVGEGGYNPLYNNCEHFANYCVFGKKESKQIDDIHQQVREMLKIKKGEEKK